MGLEGIEVVRKLIPVIFLTFTNNFSSQDDNSVVDLSGMQCTFGDNCSIFNLERPK